jgi:hypothetical protein
MPVNKNALLRYILIDQCLQRSGGASRTELLEFCNRELQAYSDTGAAETISEETLRKDLLHLRTMFGEPLDYDRQSQKWRYTVAEHKLFHLPPDRWRELMDYVRLREELQADPEMGQYLRFEQSSGEPNFRYLSGLLKALRAKSAVRFDYQRFGNQDIKTHVVWPVFLQQFHHRWYLLGFKLIETPKGWDLIRPEPSLTTWGLERFISAPDIVQIEAPADVPVFDPQVHFGNIIGITNRSHAPQSVTLCFAAEQGAYIHTQPLHHSQRQIDAPAGRYRVQLFVKLNYELEAQILQHGDRVQVLNPPELRDKIRARLQAALDAYA